MCKRFASLIAFTVTEGNQLGPDIGSISGSAADGPTIAALGFGRDAMSRIQNHREGGIASVYDRHRYADEDQRIMALAEGRPEEDKVVPIRR